MDNYPLNKDQVMKMLFLAGIPQGGKILCLGGMDTQALITRAGYKVQGLRRVLPGRDAFLDGSFPEQSFDGILSQGDMYVCGDMEAAILKAGSLLKSGGVLMMSELCEEDWQEAFNKAGLKLLHTEDTTNMWKAWYMEKLFAGEDVPEWLERPFKYYTMVCVKG